MFCHKVKYLNVIALIWLDFKFSSEPTFSSQNLLKSWAAADANSNFFFFIYKFIVSTWPNVQIWKPVFWKLSQIKNWN
jgi:hypothetical protein